MIRIRCHCGKSVKLPAKHLGKSASCPQCHGRVRIVAGERFDDSSRLKGAFIIRSGPRNEGEQVFLGGSEPIVVGKAEDANLRLLASSVSRKHCRLVSNDRGWRIEDNGSTNGLFVNGRQVKGHNLIHGDSVCVGDFELQYSYEPGKRTTSALEEELAAPSSTAVSEEDAASVLGLHFLDDTAAMEAATAAGAPAAKKSTAKPASDDEEVELFKFADDHDLAAGPPISLPVPVPASPGAGTSSVESKAKPKAKPQADACPNCKRPVSPGSAICVACGTDLKTGKMLGTDSSELGKPRSRGSGSVSKYFGDCVRGFIFLADPGALVTFIILSLIACLQPIVGYAGCLGLICTVIIQGWLASYYFNVVLSAASGEEDVPDLTLTEGWVDGILAPFCKFVATWIVALSPAIIYATSVLSSGLPTLMSPGPDIIGFFAVGVFLWPIIVLAMALGGMGSVLRLDLIIKTVLATFVPYVVVCLLTGLAFAITFVATFSMASVVALTGGNALVAEIVSLVVSVYCWIVAMRCIGLYYHHFKHRFAWSWG